MTHHWLILWTLIYMCLHSGTLQVYSVIYSCSNTSCTFDNPTLNANDEIHCTDIVTHCNIACTAQDACRDTLIYSAAEFTNVLCSARRACDNTQFYFGDTGVLASNDTIFSTISCTDRQACNAAHIECADNVADCELQCSSSFNNECNGLSVDCYLPSNCTCVGVDCAADVTTNVFTFNPTAPPTTDPTSQPTAEPTAVPTPSPTEMPGLYICSDEARRNCAADTIVCEEAQCDLHCLTENACLNTRFVCQSTNNETNYDNSTCNVHCNAINACTNLRVFSESIFTNIECWAENGCEAATFICSPALNINNDNNYDDELNASNGSNASFVLGTECNLFCAGTNSCLDINLVCGPTVEECALFCDANQTCNALQMTCENGGLDLGLDDLYSDDSNYSCLLNCDSPNACVGNNELSCIYPELGVCDCAGVACDTVAIFDGLETTPSPSITAKPTKKPKKQKLSNNNNDNQFSSHSFDTLTIAAYATFAVFYLLFLIFGCFVSIRLHQSLDFFRNIRTVVYLLLLFLIEVLYYFLLSCVLWGNSEAYSNGTSINFYIWTSFFPIALHWMLFLAIASYYNKYFHRKPFMGMFFCYTGKRKRKLPVILKHIYLLTCAVFILIFIPIVSVHNANALIALVYFICYFSFVGIIFTCLAIWVTITDFCRFADMQGVEKLLIVFNFVTNLMLLLIFIFHFTIAIEYNADETNANINDIRETQLAFEFLLLLATVSILCYIYRDFVLGNAQEEEDEAKSEEPQRKNTATETSPQPMGEEASPDADRDHNEAVNKNSGVSRPSPSPRPRGHTGDNNGERNGEAYLKHPVPNQRELNDESVDNRDIEMVQARRTSGVVKTHGRYRSFDEDNVVPELADAAFERQAQNDYDHQEDDDDEPYPDTENFHHDDESKEIEMRPPRPPPTRTKRSKSKPRKGTFNTHYVVDQEVSIWDDSTEDWFDAIVVDIDGTERICCVSITHGPRKGDEVNIDLWSTPEFIEMNDTPHLRKRSSLNVNTPPPSISSFLSKKQRLNSLKLRKMPEIPKFGAPLQQQKMIVWTDEVFECERQIPAVLAFLRDRLYEFNAGEEIGIFGNGEERIEDCCAQSPLFVEGIVSQTDINAVRHLIENGKILEFQFKEDEYTRYAHIFAELCKEYLRMLPSPLLQDMPSTFFEDITDVEYLMMEFEKIPEPNQSIVVFLWDICLQISSDAEFNHMSYDVMSRIFAPFLFTDQNSERNQQIQPYVKQFFSVGIQWREELYNNES